jgi:integrase
MTLMELIDAYLLSHALESGTEVQVRYAVRGLQKFTGSTLTVKDATSEAINRYLSSRVRKAGQLRYAKTHRTWLMTLLRFAVEIDELHEIPRNVRRIKVPESIPTAWAAEQVAQLVAAARSMSGAFKRAPNVPQSAWYTPYVMVRWDSALRMADVLSIERGDIWPGGIISIVQRKTGHAHTVVLGEETQEALASLWKLTPESRMILPQLVESRHVYTTFKKLVKSVGLNGTGRKLRISSATAAEAVERGAATRLLGHRSPDMARRHYIDPRKIGVRPVAPPPLPKLV